MMLTVTKYVTVMMLTVTKYVAVMMLTVTTEQETEQETMKQNLL